MFLRLMSCVILAAGGVMTIAAQQGDAAPGSAGWQITGTLVDAVNGVPVRNARIALASVTKRDDVTTIITGEDGRFVFSNLGAGKYALQAQARGYLTRSFDQHEQYSSSIAVGPELDSSDLLFRLPPEAAINGVVSDEAGEPVRGANVTLYLTGLAAGVDATRQRGQTMTDDEGTYRFPHLVPGHYLVAVVARPWYATHTIRTGATGTVSVGLGGPAPAGSRLDVAYPVTFYDGAMDPAKAAVIALGAGERATADMSLHPVPALHMHLNREPGDREGRAAMRLEKRMLDGPPIILPTQVTLTREGYEITGIAPGQYSLNISAIGKSGGLEATVHREIEVHESGVIDQGPDSSSAAVSAELRFEAGAQRQGALQLVNKTTGETFSEQAADDGDLVFKQPIAAGRYEVSLLGRDVYLKSIVATGAKVSGRNLEIPTGAVVKLAIIAARGQGTVRGAALREGKPCRGAMIVLVPTDPAHNQVLFRRDQSDSDGTFAIQNVVPGAYTALSIENGWDLEWTNPKVLKKYLSGGVAVQVQPNGNYDLKLAVQ